MSNKLLLQLVNCKSFKLVGKFRASKCKVLTYDQSSNGCNGKVGEIDICSSPHVLIADDDNAGGEVTKHSNNQEDAVDEGQGEKG